METLLSMTAQRGTWLGNISFSVDTIRTAARTKLLVCDRGFWEEVYWKTNAWALSCHPWKAIGSYNRFYSSFMKSGVCHVIDVTLAFFFVELMEGEKTWGMTGIFMPFIQNTHNQEFTDWFFSIPLSPLSLLWAHSFFSCTKSIVAPFLTVLPAITFGSTYYLFVSLFVCLSSDHNS